MNELEVQQALHELKNKYAQGGSLESAYPKHSGSKSVYLAGGWWGQWQPELLVKSYEALLKNPTISHVHVPLLHQYEGNAFVDGQFEPDYEWATMTYKADLRGIDNTDITVALFPVKDQDTGTAVEVGYAKGINKPVVAVFEGDAYQEPINLMISMSADSSLKLSDDLQSYNFLDIEPNMYKGRLI